MPALMITDLDMDFYIIDAIGPFFHNYNKKTVNWSKIPFRNLEKKDQVNRKKFIRIQSDFEHFIRKAKTLGYNAISLDDVAHLVNFDFYPAKLTSKIRDYQYEFGELFNLARKHKLKIYINTDIMFFNKWIDAHTRGKTARIYQLLADACEDLFRQFPVDGIIFRMGESDGIDVREDFKSRLILKKPAHVQACIKTLLPIFEQYNKQLIFRTWTVGVYPIGDLMWNPGTYHQAFNNIDSEHFIISMKYGDTDFFDHLKLNPLLKNTRHKKIIELQARREREGFGVFPWYVGWQYEKYYQQVADNPSLVGISVWSQTGGWCKWKNITYLKNTSAWNELNTAACVDIFKNGSSADAVLNKHLNSKEIEFIAAFQPLLDEILYVRGFAEKTIYLRRFRVPPLLWFYWDNVTISPLLIALLAHVGVESLSVSMADLKTVKKLGKKAGIHNIDFLYDTLRVLVWCRSALYKNTTKRKYLLKIAEYKKLYPDALDFSIKFSFQNHRLLDIFFKICLRYSPEYRFIDHVFMTPLFSFLFRVFIYFYMKHLPKFVNKQAMKIDSVFT